MNILSRFILFILGLNANFCLRVTKNEGDSELINKDNNDKIISIPLRNARNIIYYGNIQVGTPAQDFRVIFSIKSNYFWLMSSDCDSKTYDACKNHRKYNYSLSSTYEKNETVFVDYPEEKLKGHYSIDNIMANSFSLGKQNFAELNVVDSQQYYKRKPDGIFGLNIGRDKKSFLPSPFITTVLQNNIKPIFAFHLLEYHNSTNTYGGELLLGGYNKDNFVGKMDQFKNIHKDSWAIKAEEINIVDTKVCASGCEVHFSTETAFISGPEKEIESIHDKMDIIERMGPYSVVDCQKLNELPIISIKVDGKSINMKPEDYVLRTGISLCISGFKSNEMSEESNYWTLGSRFLKAFYTVFDKETGTIGIAKAK